jgi:hypothetical protein
VEDNAKINSRCLQLLCSAIIGVPYFILRATCHGWTVPHCHCFNTMFQSVSVSLYVSGIASWYVQTHRNT